MPYQHKNHKHLKKKKKLEKIFYRQSLQAKIEILEQAVQQTGRELHDNVGQLLSTSRMLIGLTERSLQNPPDTLLTANATLGRAITELRSISKFLNGDFLSHFNFIKHLEDEIKRINTTGGTNALLQATCTPTLSASKQIILFRLIQEFLQKFVKQGRCNNLKINLSSENNNFVILIKYEGEDDDESALSKDIEWETMEYRAQLLGGSIHYKNSGEGTNIIIQLPQTDKEHEN